MKNNTLGERSQVENIEKVDISIILHAYQQVDYVRNAIKSILDQQLSPEILVELIFCDDGSHDGTTEILRSYNDSYPGLSTLLVNVEKKQFPSPCTPGRWILMKAIREAKGDLITFLDGDDIWTDVQKLQLQFEEFNDHPDTLICAHNGWDVQLDGTREDHVRSRYSRSSLPNTFMQEEILLSCQFQKASLMIRKDPMLVIHEFLSAAPSFDWTVLVMLAEKKPVRYIDRYMADRNRLPTGITSSFNKYVGMKWNIRMLSFLNNVTDGRYDETFKKKIDSLVRICLNWGMSEKDGERATEFYRMMNEIGLWKNILERIRILTFIKLPRFSRWYYRMRSKGT